MEVDKHDKQEVSLAAPNEISMGGSVSTISSELVDVFWYFQAPRIFYVRTHVFALALLILLWQEFKRGSTTQLTTGLRLAYLMLLIVPNEALSYRYLLQMFAFFKSKKH